MSDTQFGDPPKNGKQVVVTGNHPAPTPYHAEVRVHGTLVETRCFTTKAEAQNFQQEEVTR
jgi:hypothetical protein